MKPKIYNNVVCLFEGCKEVAKTRGFCKRHYTAMLRKGVVVPQPLQRTIKCSVKGCASMAKTKGLCNKHYQRLMKKGDVCKGEGYKHGLSKEPEYSVWSNIIDRCENKNNHSYKNYGGRGIYICDKWRNSFMSFYKDMGKRPSERHQIDRTNNDGPYAPENCKWVTRTINARNKRNVKMTEEKVKEFREKIKNGETVYKAAKEFNISYTNAKDISNRRIWK